MKLISSFGDYKKKRVWSVFLNQTWHSVLVENIELILLGKLKVSLIQFSYPDLASEKNRLSR